MFSLSFLPMSPAHLSLHMQLASPPSPLLPSPPISTPLPSLSSHLCPYLLLSLLLQSSIPNPYSHTMLVKRIRRLTTPLHHEKRELLTLPRAANFRQWSCICGSQVPGHSCADTIAARDENEHDADSDVDEDEGADAEQNKGGNEGKDGENTHADENGMGKDGVHGAVEGQGGHGCGDPSQGAGEEEMKDQEMRDVHVVDDSAARGEGKVDGGGDMDVETGITGAYGDGEQGGEEVGGVVGVAALNEQEREGDGKGTRNGEGEGSGGIDDGVALIHDGVSAMDVVDVVAATNEDNKEEERGGYYRREDDG